MTSTPPARVHGPSRLHVAAFVTSSGASSILPSSLTLSPIHPGSRFTLVRAPGFSLKGRDRAAGCWSPCCRAVAQGCELRGQFSAVVNETVRTSWHKRLSLSSDRLLAGESRKHTADPGGGNGHGVLPTRGTAACEKPVCAVNSLSKAAGCPERRVCQACAETTVGRDDMGSAVRGVGDEDLGSPRSPAPTHHVNVGEPLRDSVSLSLPV